MKKLRAAIPAAALIAASLGLLSACAGTPRPIIDAKHVDMNQYRLDLGECEEFGAEVDIGGGMARSALVGAIAGAAMGAIGGDLDPAAGVGAVAGATGGGLEDQRTRESVVKECLRGRGYEVLN